MIPPNLITLPAELRDEIVQLILPPKTDSYCLFEESLKQQPALINTCKQFRAEARALFFANIKLLIAVTLGGISRFQQFVQAAENDILLECRHLSFALDCAGSPEFCPEQQAPRPHSVLYDIRRLDGDHWEVTESHGVWRYSEGEWTFEAMKERDHLGMKTCTRVGALPIQQLVAQWPERVRKVDILKLIQGLRAHPLTAPRLRLDRV